MDRIVKPSQQGFTLLELVVVVAVISILSITAVLSVGRPDEPTLTDAARFQAAYTRLRNAAIFGGSSYAIALTDKGWQSLRRRAAGGDDGRDGGGGGGATNAKAGGPGWVPLAEGQTFRGEARFRGRHGAFEYGLWPDDLTPDLVFLPDGQVTPFEVSFISPQRATRCKGSGWAGMTCDP